MDVRLTIRNVRVRPLSLRPTRPMETAAGVLRITSLVLIDLHTEEGITGRSYVRCYAPEALEPLADLLATLASLLGGHSAAPAVIEHTIGQHVRLLGARGLVGMAAAGIDMAAWDALARAGGVPLVTLLGGHPQPVPAYASLHSMSAAGAAQEALEAVERGFAAVKVKLGRGDVAADLETIRAIRRAAGEHVGIMVDYNQSLSVPEALARLCSLDGEGLDWIEEPTRAGDFAGHARIAREARTAIQLGENCWGPHDAARCIAAGASDHIMLSAMKIGGVSGWLRAAALAGEAGLPVSSHAFPEFSVHLLGASPTHHRLEYLDHAGGILTQPIRVDHGFAVTPGGPGSGLEWDEAAIQRAEAA